ncbi:hypothetical protein [Sphaerospermopsis sp. FACHB-1194]|uniref:hypothetical protein n=1 Tax=Sphaerospermopsis sp. FACHB-1194 TaxID=2692862 RepID=UPI001681749D|nr:hypothetical protein [Sphaerospermopsis sp. FACHB-1194]MBD2143828.1 hypothetical protein [Sphaerospermopsis sp. FACHB-1194]
MIKWQVQLAGSLPPDNIAKLQYIIKLLLNPWVISSFTCAFLAAISWMAAMTKFDLYKKAANFGLGDHYEQKNFFIDQTSVVIFTICLSIFVGFLLTPISTDINGHAKAVIRIANGNLSIPFNFLYYVLIYIITFFSTGTKTVYLASILVLSCSIVAKYLITKQFLMKNLILPSNSLSISSNQKLTDRFYQVYSLMLTFVFSLPLSLMVGGYYYLGNTPPNIWHNSTTIFLMPFALLLFWQSYEQIKTPKADRIVWISLLIILNIIIKPSFFFVFLVCYPIFFIKQFGWTKLTFVNLIPLLIGCFMLGIQYLGHYIWYIGSLTEGGDHGVTISLFTVWSHFSPNIPLSLLGSLLFPLLCIILHWKTAVNHLLIKYACFQYLIAITIYALLMETGLRQYHGNFGWQCIVASYILYLSASILLIEKLGLNQNNNAFSNLISLTLSISPKNKLILITLMLHFLAGIGYIIRIFITRKYL